MTDTSKTDGWIFCPRCKREKTIKLCKRRTIGGGYEMKSGDRRAVVFAGIILCPRCQYEQPIPPSQKPAGDPKPESQKVASTVTRKESQNGPGRN